MACVESVDYAEIAVRAPAVDGRVEESIHVSTVAKVPPDEGVEFCLKQLAEAVCVVKSVDEARGLAALRASIGIVFGHDELDVCSACAEIISDHLAKIHRVRSPVAGGLEQRHIAV